MGDVQGDQGVNADQHARAPGAPLDLRIPIGFCVPITGSDCVHDANRASDPCLQD
jgi:hypothetical protein